MPFAYLYYILLSFIIAWALTPISFKLLHRLQILDKPNSRKIHKNDILTGGGVIIFLTLLVSFAFPHSLFLVLIENISGLHILNMPLGGDPTGYQYISLFSDLRLIGGFLLGFVILFGMGILDDKFNLKPKIKFIIQIISCSIFILFSGYDISFSFLFGDNPTLSFFLTLLFMISIINAFNLIDGLDGLASGIALISLISILLISSSISANYLMCILIGGLCSFLIKNTHPAKIFLGDSGSYILGYSISIFIILVGNQQEFQNWNLSYLLLLVGIPAIDIIYAFSRRLLRRENIFSADKKHIHHIILDLGLCHRDAVLVLYLIQSFLCTLGLFLLGFKIGVAIVFFLLPIAYLVFKYCIPKKIIQLFDKNNQQIKKGSNFSLFILIGILFFFILRMLNNSSLMLYIGEVGTGYFSDYIFIFIFLILLILTLASVFNGKYNYFSIILFSSIIALDFSDPSSATRIIGQYASLAEKVSVENNTAWLDIISLYIWYILIAVVVIDFIIRKLEDNKNDIFDLTDYILFMLFLILSFSPGLDLINFQYLGKIFLIFMTYKIILSNKVINKYRLAYIVNATSLLFMLFILIL